MKKLICTLMLAVVAMLTVNARTFVLVTGISNYEGEENDLHQTTKDAKRFAELMESQTKDITLLTGRNVNYANVMEKLRAICNRAQANDRIIFFYSGHGAPGGLCAYDRLLPHKDVVELLATSAAKEKYCFIDACFAGTLHNGEWDGRVPEGVAYFLSCRPDEISIELPTVGAGIFTQALLKGMRGKADKNNDKQITVEELFRYMYGDVVRRADKYNHPQHPQLIAPKSMYNKVVTRWN